MAPKSLAPELTESEKGELARLLEKSKLASMVGHAATEVDRAKMEADWATWRPEASTAAGYPMNGQAGERGTASEIPKFAADAAIFTPGGITYDGNQGGGYHRNRKSIVALMGPGSAAASSEVTYGAMTDGSKRRRAWDGPPMDDFELINRRKLWKKSRCWTLLLSCSISQWAIMGHPTSTQLANVLASMLQCHCRLTPRMKSGMTPYVICLRFEINFCPMQNSGTRLVLGIPPSGVFSTYAATNLVTRRSNS